MRRIPRWFYLWTLAGPVWAPLAWLLPIMLSVGRVGHELQDASVIWSGLLLPMAIVWAAAVVIHLSLWATWRRADIVAVTLALPSIGASLVAIGFVAYLHTACDHDGTPYSLGSCVDRPDLPMFVLFLGGLIVLVSLPAWCIAGIIEAMHLVRAKRRARGPA